MLRIVEGPKEASIEEMLLVEDGRYQVIRDILDEELMNPPTPQIGLVRAFNRMKNDQERAYLMFMYGMDRGIIKILTEIVPPLLDSATRPAWYQSYHS